MTAIQKNIPILFLSEHEKQAEEVAKRNFENIKVQTIGILREESEELAGLTDVQVGKLYALYSKEIHKCLWAETYVMTLHGFREWLLPIVANEPKQFLPQAQESIISRMQFIEKYYLPIKELEDGDRAVLANHGPAGFQVYRCRNIFIVFALGEFTGMPSFRGAVPANRIPLIFDVISCGAKRLSDQNTEDANLTSEFITKYSRSLSRLDHEESLSFPEFGRAGAVVYRCKYVFVVFSLCELSGIENYCGTVSENQFSTLYSLLSGLK
jgi:hypothetical protein